MANPNDANAAKVSEESLQQHSEIEPIFPTNSSLTQEPELVNHSDLQPHTTTNVYNETTNIEELNNHNAVDVSTVTDATTAEAALPSDVLHESNGSLIASDLNHDQSEVHVVRTNDINTHVGNEEPLISLHGSGENGDFVTSNHEEVRDLMKKALVSDQCTNYVSTNILLV